MGRRSYPTPIINRKKEKRGTNDFEAMHYKGNRPWYNLLNSVILKHIQDYKLLEKRGLIQNGKIVPGPWPSYINVNGYRKLKVIDFYYTNKKMVFDLLKWFYESLPWYVHYLNELSDSPGFQIRYKDIMKQLELPLENN